MLERTHSHITLHGYGVYLSYSPVSEHVKPIPVSEFSIHVEKLHADRDKLFEMEYMVN